MWAWWILPLEVCPWCKNEVSHIPGGVSLIWEWWALSLAVCPWCKNDDSSFWRYVLDVRLMIRSSPWQCVVGVRMMSCLFGGVTLCMNEMWIICTVWAGETINLMSGSTQKTPPWKCYNTSYKREMSNAFVSNNKNDTQTESLKRLASCRYTIPQLVFHNGELCHRPLKKLLDLWYLWDPFP